VVLAVSVDPDTMLAAWAKELQTPVLFGSDTNQVVGKLYGSIRGKLDNRSLFVIDSGGRIVKRMQPFNELSADSYTELGTAVAGTIEGRR
jgi:peroxiredoxin Q/BCP